MITTAQVEEAAARWGLSETATPVAVRLAAYGNLLLHWNQRLSLTSIRDEPGILERHLMEGLFATTTPRNDASSATGSGNGNTGGVGQWDLQNAYKYVSEAYGGYHARCAREASAGGPARAY